MANRKAKIFVWAVMALLPMAAFAASPDFAEPPRLPKCMDKLMKIDQARLRDFYSEYDLATEGNGAAEDFLFAYLPRKIFSKLLFESNDRQELPSDFGLLYYSGFQGGVWLNQSLAGKNGQGIGPGGVIRALNPWLLLYVRTLCKERVKLAQTGSLEQKREQAGKNLDALIQSYGYNKGYLLEILKHPPQGSKLGPDFISCEGMIGCDYKGIDNSLLQPVSSVREMIDRPSSQEWERIRKKLAEKMPDAEKRGRGVWANIMADREFSPHAYQQLIEISAQFLAINEAIMLKTASAVAERDDPALSNALLADAAFRTWLIGYMSGLGQS